MPRRIKTMLGWAGVCDDQLQARVLEDTYGQCRMPEVFTARRDARRRFQRVVRIEIRVLPMPVTYFVMALFGGHAVYQIDEGGKTKKVGKTRRVRKRAVEDCKAFRAGTAK